LTVYGNRMSDNKKAPIYVPPSVVFRDPVHVLAFGLGLGLSPKAPGTFGTLLGIPLAIGFTWAGLPAYLVATVLLSIVGCWICGVSAQRLGIHDHGGIVFDEVVGYMVTLLPVPLGLASADWLTWVVGFAVFRFFDIIKPWPIRLIDRHVQGGLGIMLDDLLAGVFGAIVMVFMP